MTRIQDRSTLDESDWKFIRRAVAERAGFRCEKCNRFLGMKGHADHIIRRAKCEAAGIDPKDMGNLQWLCVPCHNKKSSRERWEGHTKADRSIPRRTKVKGRSAYHAAIFGNSRAISCTDNKLAFLHKPEVPP